MGDLESLLSARQAETGIYSDMPRCPVVFVDLKIQKTCLLELKAGRFSKHTRHVHWDDSKVLNAWHGLLEWTQKSFPGNVFTKWVVREASMFTTYTGAPCSLCPKVKSCKRNSTSIQPQKNMRRPSINLKNSLLVEGRFWIKHHESPDKKTSGFIPSGQIIII